MVTSKFIICFVKSFRMGNVRWFNPSFKIFTHGTKYVHVDENFSTNISKTKRKKWSRKVYRAFHRIFHRTFPFWCLHTFFVSHYDWDFLVTFCRVFFLVGLLSIFSLRWRTHQTHRRIFSLPLNQKENLQFTNESDN